MNESQGSLFARSLLLVCPLLMLLSSSSARAQNVDVSIDKIDGLRNDSIVVGQPVTYHIRFSNNSGDVIASHTNGFRLYANNASTRWSPNIVVASTGTVTTGPSGMYDGGEFFSDTVIIPTGDGADTIGYGGFRILGTGIPDGFNSVVFTITVTLTGSEDGNQFCIDSSWYRPSNSWLWSMESSGSVAPNWDGPHCRPVVPSGQTAVIESESNTLPDGYSLDQNYPNPFNPMTRISFELPRRSEYVLTVYNLIGQELKQFYDIHSAGHVEIEWDASSYASGVYYYRLEVAGGNEVKKMVLLK